MRIRVHTSIHSDRVRVRNFSYNSVHAEGAGRIARVAAEAGVPRLLHVSHLNASPGSPSEFYKSKARGEDLVREAFPSATIVRPATMFGYEDRLLTNMASMSPFPVSARPCTGAHALV